MMRRPGYNDVISHDGQILQSVLICIDLHGSTVAAERLKSNSFTLYTGCFSKVHIVSLWLRETKVHTTSHTLNRSHLASSIAAARA